MSSKKLKKEEKEWALSTKRFKTVSDDTPVDITKLSEDDKGLYYKDEPYTTKKTTATPDHYLLPQVCPVSEINPQEQGFIPLYKREAITDVLHEVSGFQTDYQFIL